MRPRGRRLVRAAAVGGAGYMVGKSAAESRQREEAQNAQIADLQQQQAAMAPQYGPQYVPQQYPPPQYAPPQPAPAAAPPAPQPPVPARDPMEALRQLGDLRAAGVLTDEEFAAKKAQLLGQI